jgi:hypothetical protein
LASWAFLTDAAEPDRVQAWALSSRVIPLVDTPGERGRSRPGPQLRQIVHLDVVGIPDQAIDELRAARLVPG